MYVRNEKSSKVSTLIDKALMGLLVSVAGFVASEIQSASRSISELNEKVAVIITQLSGSVETIKDHENRIRNLELRPQAARGR